MIRIKDTEWVAKESIVFVAVYEAELRLFPADVDAMYRVDVKYVPDACAALNVSSSIVLAEIARQKEIVKNERDSGGKKREED